MYRTDLFETAGLTMPDKPDWDLHRRRGAQDHRPRQRHQRHLPARQGRLGREHGLPHRAQQLLRRQVVRREVGAAVRPAGLEGVAAVLRRPDEGRRSRRRLVERLQREPDAVPAGQVRRCGSTPPSPPPSSPTRRTRPSPTRSASRSSRTRRASRTTATGSGRGTSRSRPARRTPTPPRPSSSGRPPRTTPRSSPRKEGWADAPPGTRTSLYENAGLPRPPRPSPSRRWRR